MDYKQNIIPLKDLNLTSRFLFDEVMDDPQTHQDVLSIIFGKEIPLLDKAETEKELRVSPLIRSIRLDVFSIDEENVIYSTEMQAQKKVDLAKRSRYYQALIDTGLLKPGIPDYNLLNASYIIIITPFDLFGHGKYQYTFEARCREVPECILEDQAVRIFLNTRGTNDDEVSKELADFLHYLENTTASVADASGSERIRRIHERVHKVKLSEEIGVKYMQAWEEKYFEREEGRAEGRNDLLKSQIRKKLLKGKSPEIIADEVEEELNTVLTIIQEITEENTSNNQ
ncbi:Rpn family recombination-promoting nuclease/putative transposase [Roseburia hominis]